MASLYAWYLASTIVVWVLCQLFLGDEISNYIVLDNDGLLKALVIAIIIFTFDIFIVVREHSDSYYLKKIVIYLIFFMIPAVVFTYKYDVQKAVTLLVFGMTLHYILRLLYKIYEEIA